MTLGEFCKSIGRLGFSNAQKAVAILWFFDQQESGIEKTSAELSKEIIEHHIGNPNPASLRKLISKTGCVYTRAGSFRIREDKKNEIRGWVSDALVGIPEVVPIDEQFLPEEVFKSTRKYIDKVCIQLNGSYFHGYFDCTAVMIRRLIETLIIEAYEKEKRQTEIQDGSGNYFMLGELISRSTATGGLTLGRDAKKALKVIKKLGDRSAHNRKYNAKKLDLDGIKDGLRLCVEELMNTADLYPK